MRDNAMVDQAVALIRDIELFEHLERRLVEMFGCRLRFAATAEEALEFLKSQTVPTLFLDSRITSADKVMQEMLERLTSDPARMTAVNVVTVGDQNLPRSLAGTFWQIASEHLMVRDGVVDWSQATERLTMLLAARRARPLPLRRHVEAGGIQLTTYCQPYFNSINEMLRVAHRDVTLLLIGETGTGKTTMARFIHNRSPRRDRAFQHLACGALPADLIESELFGHTRGAFTGAERNKLGRFQAAGRGTLLLDEIDVLDLRQQVKLLRVIETGEYELVGSTETRVSEARLIVASNVELEEMTRREEFRSDLYYRLNVLEFRLPALRDRLPDLVPLALQFIEESCIEHGITVDTVDREFLAALSRYQWPGNLRELKNHMRRAVLFSEERHLAQADLSHKILSPESGSFRESLPRNGGATTIAEHVARSEREVLQSALAAHGQNRTRTAQALGLSRVGLYKKLKRLGLMAATPAE